MDETGEEAAMVVEDSGRVVEDGIEVAGGVEVIVGRVSWSGCRHVRIADRWRMSE